jgi:hypothetical protein
MGTRGGAWIWVCLLALLISFGTRWPLIPHDHLFHIDNVNFALALKDFNPALHQPQPPGDPLYVGLAKLLHVFVPRVETLFPITGVLGSTLALVLMWRMGTRLFGSRAGAVTALLLAVNPIFWLAGIGNYVRTFLSAGAIAVALCVWKCWTQDSKRAAPMFYASAAVLGAAAGFRPELGLVLLPLVASSVWIHRFHLRQITFAILCLAATSMPWVFAISSNAVGFQAFYRLNSSYVAEQSRHSSLFYGASVMEAARMAAGSIYWVFLGAVSWFWAIPTALRRSAGASTFTSPFRFLLVWFVPPFLFHTLVHIHNPDHALVSIPVICLLGGFSLTRLPGRTSVLAVGCAIALNVLLFFYPKGSPFWASNYRIAEYTIQTARDVCEDIADLQGEGSLVVIWKGGFITPQEMSYYFPDVPVLSLPDAGGTPSIRLANVSRPFGAKDAKIVLPSNRIAWVDPVDRNDADVFAPLGSGRRLRALHFVELAPGSEIPLAGLRFTSSARSQ